jgi:hypothetical protein
VPEPAPEPHPLLAVLLAAAEGSFPPVDGRVDLVPPLRPGLRGVLSFTGHAYVATDQTGSELADLVLDGFGAALHPSVLLRLAGPAGQVGVLDATLVGRGTGTGGPGLPQRTNLDHHPRVRHARAIRHDVRVHGDERGLVTLSRGLAGRLELSIEVVDQGNGVGPSLLAAGLHLVPAGEPVFAAVSPGNVRSLRLFLTAGFRPIGSEVIIQT